MKTKLLLIIIILSLLSTITCSSIKNSSEQWEGITDNAMRVTISEFFPLDENMTDDDIRNMLKDRLNQRASLIIASHLSINIPKNSISRDNELTLNKLINDSLSGLKFTNYECTENNYCQAHGEYDITVIQENLKTLTEKKDLEVIKK